MRISRFVALSLCGVLAAAASPSRVVSAQRAGEQNPPPAFTDPDRRAKLSTAFPEIDRLVEAFMKRSRVPGAAWGIVIDGELAHAGVAGHRDLAAGAPVDRNTVFRIASMTKSFTAMAIVKLRDDGKLSLEDPVERHVPELKSLLYPTGDSPRLTIRHLLSHASGFPEDNPWGDQQLAVTEDEFTRMLERGIPFANAPGVAYEYSNYGFAILGRIITNASGTPYRQYISESILQPLGMRATTLEPREVPRDQIAIGYRWEDGTWKDEPPLPDGAFGAMGGMLTSLDDLSRYVSAFLAAFPPHDGPETLPVRRASLREMQQIWRARQAVVTRGPSGTVQLNAGGYGYGLGISQTCEFDHVVAHSGGLPGFGSLMRWLPEYGVGFIAFGNLTYTGWGNVASGVFEALMKTGALQPRRPQPSDALVEMRDAVSRLVVGWDDRLADDVAAMNLYIDRAKERRRREVETLRAKVGKCSPPDAFEFIENALRGEWIMPCERGSLRVSITLAPTVPPRVQALSVSDASARPSRPLPACRQ